MDSIRSALVRAIYSQESNSGQVDTSTPNYAGALGPMQVTKPTFVGMQNNGLIPQDWNWEDPEHSTRAGIALLNSYMDKYGDDPALAAAAYYGGEKAVKDGQIVDFGDRKNPKAPRTSEYAQMILSRMGLKPGGKQAKVPAKLLPSQTPDEMLAEAMPGPVGQSGSSAIPVISDTAPKITANPQAAVDQAKAAESSAQKEAQFEQDRSVLDIAQDSFMHQGVLGAILKAAAKPAFKPDPTWALDPKLLNGMSEDEQQELKDASSKEEADWAMFDIKDRRDMEERIGLSGAGAGILGSMIAGLPEGYLLGLGAVKGMELAKVGATQLAAQGRAGAAWAAAAAENVGGNIAGTAAAQAAQGRFNTEDYATAVAMGLVITPLAALGSLSHASSVRAAEDAAKMRADAAAKLEERSRNAAANLPPDATPEQVAAEMTRLEQAELAQATEIKKASRKLIDAQTDETGRPLPTADEEAAVKAAQEDIKPVDVAERPPIKQEETAAINQGDSVKAEEVKSEVIPTASVRTEKLRTDAEILAVTKPDGTPAVTSSFTLASRLDELAGSKLKEVGLFAKRLREALKDDSIKVYVSDTEGLRALSRGTATRSHYMPSDHAIYLDSRSMMVGQEWVTLHEAGHALTEYKIAYGKANPDSAHGKIVTQMEAIRNIAKTELDGPNGAKFKTDGVAPYLLDNVSELNAGLWSTRRGMGQFGDLLRSIPYQGTTLLSKFVGAVQKLLGIATKERPLFLQALGLSEKLIDTPLHVSVVGRDGKALSVRQAPSDFPGDTRAKELGIDLLPGATANEKAEARVIRSLYSKAETPAAPWNKVDPERLKTLAKNKLFDVASTSVHLLSSKNPILRMVGATLVENPAGAAGRGQTASIGSWLNYRKALGNFLPELQNAYGVWRRANGGSVLEDVFGGKRWAQFNRSVAEEIESRGRGSSAHADPSIQAAANTIEGVFERLRKMQIDSGTLGHQALPESSRGYMPHRMSAEKVRNLTTQQREQLHAAMADQFATIEGFDPTFSAELASKYLSRIEDRATGGWTVPINPHDPAAADIVEQAMRAAGLSGEELRSAVQRFTRGAASHTKGRLNLDLLEDQGGWRMLDLFETDMANLVRQQALRVAGEAALADHGVLGKPGLRLLRQAAALGNEGVRATADELAAFDQVAAELLGEPFGTHGTKWLDRAMQVTSLARLGGMGFTQFAEALNGIWHVGATRAFESVGGVLRLRNEAKALARGEKVDNPLLHSIEAYSGVEFGAESYKIKFPFDNGSLEYNQYGRDSVTLVDRLLRGGTHLQGKLSLWRGIHAAQHRGMAEQIVAKAVRYISEGKSDTALADMGIGPGLVARLKDDIQTGAAVWDNGRLTEFDIARIRDKDAANEFVQAIHRGTNQIIQGTFTGETGKWAHDGLLRLLTQFRTFSITSMEKQWARQRGNYGTAGALGILLGTMSIAWPIYVARVYASSIGKSNQQSYLDKQLTPAQIARATLNYVGISGLSGDLLDGLTALTGAGKVTGGRAAAETGFIGTVVAPAAGVADDIWKGLQNSKNGTNPHDLIKSLPFSKLPILQQGINALQ